MSTAYRELDTSERQYYKLLETLPLIVYSVEPTAPYAPMYVSAGVEALGYTREEWLERPDRWLESIHPDDRARVIAATERAFASGEGIDYEYRMIARDGAVHWVQDKGAFVRDDDGEAVQWRGFMVDVTARKETELALAESEERYRKLIESSPDAIFVHADGHVVFANPSAVTLFRATSVKDLIGFPVANLVTPERRAGIEERIKLVIATGQTSAPMDIPILALDGTPIDVEVSGAAITLHGRVAVQVTARDVSARRRAEHAVRKAEEQLRHAQRLEVVGRLAGGVAHDFNNILTVIASHTSFVIDAAENRPDIRSEMLEIASATKRAADLTRQLLAFGRRQVLQPVVLDADDVVAEMVRMLRRVVPEDVRMSARRSDGQALVRVDRGQLEQVLTNLIVNARDAMASGGSLTLRTDFVDVAHGLDAMGEPIVGGSYVRIGVRDNGTGMDEITLARAFEPFFTTKPMGVGNGLGLSSVHGIVKQSGGFVTIHSALGRGTLVAVHLPRVEPLPASTP